MYQLSVRSHFDAAHYIKDYHGRCRRVHGHRWEVEVVLEGKKLDMMNILADFGDVQDALRRMLHSKFDHFLLNETLKEENLTAEFLAKLVYEEFGLWYGPPSLSDKVSLAGVTVWESPDCCVKYYGEEK